MKYYDLYRLRAGREPVELGCDLTIKECNTRIAADKKYIAWVVSQTGKSFGQVTYKKEPMDY